MDKILERPDLSMLVDCIKKSNISHILESQDQLITVFAPTNNGMSKTLGFHEGVMDGTLNQTYVASILKRHKITGHGKVRTEDIRGFDGPEISLDDGTGTIHFHKYNNGSIVAIEKGHMNRTVNLIETDIDASNGVLHIIDGLL